MKIPSFKNPIARGYTRGTLYALILTLAGVLLFALFVKIAGMSDSAIKPIVQIIKAISIFVGVSVAIKSIEKRAWLHGGILGLVYTIFAFFALSIIDSNFGITSGFFIETLFAISVGVASAMLIRLRKRDA